MHRAVYASLGLALLALAPVARAADPGAPPDPSVAPARMPDLPLAPTTSPGAPLPLSLNDAILTSLEKNLNLQVQRYDPLIASEGVREAWGAYDPEYFGELGYSSTATPTGNALIGPTALQEKKTDGTTGLRGLVPLLGTQYNLGYGGDRLVTNSRIASLSPSLGSSLLAEVRQPLLKNFLYGAAWTQVKVSRATSELVDEEFRRIVMDTVRDVESAYWGVVAASEQLRVAEKSLETSRALLDQVKTQYEVGVVSRVEVTEAEAGVAERDVNLIRARNAYRAAQDRLIDRVLSTDLTPSSTLEIEPTDRPESYVKYEVDENAATQKAFANRPELAAANKEIERQELQLRFAKNQKLPQVDVVGRYGYQGLVGDANPNQDPLFGASVGPTSRNWWSSQDDFFGKDGDKQWSARGVVSIPIGNNTAAARANQAEFQLDRQKARTRRLAQDIVLEVRDSVRNLRSALEGIEAAERRRVASAEQLRAERIRLENGESTPFDVLQRERDLVDAESQKITATQIYRDSATALDRAQGTILETHAIRVDDVKALR